MTVNDYYGINEQILGEIAADNESDYWQNCEDFYLSVLDRDINTLSEKQKDWLKKIKENVEEKEFSGYGYMNR